MTGPADTAAANLRAFLDARPERDDYESSDIILTEPDPNPGAGRRWLHLTRADLRAVLDEREQLAARVAEQREALVYVNDGASASERFADHALRVRDEALTLLGQLVDHEDGPCALDHHGYCQAHPGGGEIPCTTIAARQLLATDAARRIAALGTEDATALCGAQIPASTARNLGTDPATTCARLPDHFGFAHADAAGDVMWMSPARIEDAT